MYIRIERGSSTPISRQIAEQVRAHCVGGLLKPGALLPSVRQLARELAVNVNTIVRVYERLAAEGLVEMRHGEGTFVMPQTANTAAVSELQQQREQFAREFRAIVRRGLLLGLSTQDLRRLVAAGASEAKAQLSKDTSEQTHG